MHNIYICIYILYIYIYILLYAYKWGYVCIVIGTFCMDPPGGKGGGGACKTLVQYGANG